MDLNVPQKLVEGNALDQVKKRVIWENIVKTITGIGINVHKGIRQS